MKAPFSDLKLPLFTPGTKVWFTVGGAVYGTTVISVKVDPTHTHYHVAGQSRAFTEDELTGNMLAAFGRAD